jgi:hypothetical protein
VLEADWGVVEANLAGEVAAEASFVVVVVAEANSAGVVLAATAGLAEQGAVRLEQGAAGRVRSAGLPGVVPEAGEPARRVWAKLRFFPLPGKK